MHRIRNWDKHFESNESRKLKTLEWVRIPNKQDSLAFRTIATRKDGPVIFAAWVLMLQVASKQNPRGDLPLSPDELGIVTGFPAEIFSKAFEVLKSPKISWIEQYPDVSGESGPSLKRRGEEIREEEKTPLTPLRGEWFSDLAFSSAWETWARERKKKPGQRQYDQLVKISDGDLKKAIAVLNQSIDNQWRGIFHLKNGSKPSQIKTFVPDFV